MATIVILKKDGKNEELEVKESPEKVGELANGDGTFPYNKRTEFITLTKPNGLKVTINKRFIAYVK